MADTATPMRDDAPVLVARRGDRLDIVMNRPRARNAQNQALRDGLVDALDLLESDDELRCAILTGAGGQAFSAGADIKEMPALFAARRLPRPYPHRREFAHFERLREVTKPVIAAIDGFAVGGGLELALLCDMRVATEASSFGLPEPRNVGGTPGPAMSYLTRMIPTGEAMRMFLTGAPLPARRAYEIGLVQELAPDRDGMFAAADALADEIALCAPQALRMVKTIVRMGTSMTIEQVDQLGFVLDELTGATAGDRADAVASFVDGRE